AEQPLRLASVGGGESVIDVADAVVDEHAARQADGLVERLNEGNALQQAARLECPVLALKEDVAIEPGESDAFGGQGGQGGIEQAFLLPHDVTAPHAQHVGGGGQFKAVVAEGALDCQQGQSASVEGSAEALVVGPPCAVAVRVEVGGDGPRAGCGEVTGGGGDNLWHERDLSPPAADVSRGRRMSRKRTSCAVKSTRVCLPPFSPPC